MNIRYRVELTEAERAQLMAMLSGGRHAARKLKRAQILLAAETGVGDEEIARSVSVGGSTVYRTKRRFVEGNLDLALSEEARPGAARKLSGKETALLIATACSAPPEGRKRWTLDQLADAMVRLTGHEELSRETVRRRLAEDDLKPWRRDMWCIPRVDGEYVARMEDVLDLYAEKPDPKHPVVCFDESPTQLIGEVRQPLPAAPRQPERYDCEYRRNGTANLFVFLDAHRGWRHVKATQQRTAKDFAECMRDLVDTHYPKAELIRVVLDNLSTHTAGALYETFPAPEAHRILQRIEFLTQLRRLRQPRQLAEHGGDRDRRAALPVPGPPYRRVEEARLRNQGLGKSTQCRSRAHQMAVHNRESPRQAGTRLSRHSQRVKITVTRY